MSSDDNSARSRGVEIGTVLPRNNHPRESDEDSLQFRRRDMLGGAVGLAAGAGLVVPLVGGGVLVGALASIVGRSGAHIISVVFALGLLSIAVGLVVRTHRTDENQTPTMRSVPDVPHEVAFEHLSGAAVTESAAHLTGARDGCHPPRGYSDGEFVVARITEKQADALAAIPETCAKRRRQSGLFPVLVGVPNAEPSVMEEVSDAYASTLLVDADQRESIPQLLELLPYLCAEPERDAISGIGSALLTCIDPSETNPHDAHLAEELRSQVGTPLSAEVNRSRWQSKAQTAPHGSDSDAEYSDRAKTERSPNVTVAAAPPEYLKTTIESLPEIDDPVVAVRSDDDAMIRVARFYMEEELSTDPDRDEDIWTVRKATPKGEMSGQSDDFGRNDTDTTCTACTSE